MIQGLPTELEVNGRYEPIRWEYTAVLDIIAAMNDPDLEDDEKAFASLWILYENFEHFRNDDYDPAFEALITFMNNGVSEQVGSAVKTVDFEQDYNLLVPAINRVAGTEIRNHDDIHWWTFLSWFMEIGECTYSTVLTIRSKRKKGKQLEKWEQEFYEANRDMVDIRRRLTEAEKEKERWLNSLLD